MSKKAPAKEEKIEVPSYIVTYSDMITLLLTFFVMLLSMAETQNEDHKFMAGKSSLKKAISSFGLSGFLVSRSKGTQFEHPNPTYKSNQGEDEKKGRSIDAETEMMRRMLMDIENLMTISPTQINGEQKTPIPITIQFRSNSWQLSENDEKTLKSIASQIRTNFSTQEPIVYVLGLAADEPSYRSRMVVSAQRAQVVADSLKRYFTKESLDCPVFSWGSGSGGEWIGKSGIANRDSHILIVVLSK